ncbi:MAG: 4-alpha-glucanotransferase [Leptolyngbyaceae cyanobacterium bins.59]|nr:4-alpha-glucanotransferase [Leptolyngbyaceae cyanobacterium bins.59]
MNFPRSSGILLHPTSFPGPYGIGDLGRSAYEFVEFLQRSGQTLWQILPLGPTGYEHSPYIMNFSTFAGNPLLISLDALADQGLLEEDELLPIEDSHRDRVDFQHVVPFKTKLLKRAFQRFQSLATSGQREQLAQFCREQVAWLQDFVLFMALLEANGGKNWNEWDRPIARREPDALQKAAVDLKDSIEFHQFLQFQFFDQWQRLRTYANDRHIQIIGDISIYVCHNSSDVWAAPELFKLDPDTLAPAFIAGVPPDYFSATGQLWGNPVYHWDALQKTGFDWWIRRFQTTLQYVDLVRIDHFRGFEAYWQVSAGEETAINGEWIKAPGAEFFTALGDRLGSLPVLAEDLGIITPEVEELRDRFGFPGMKILQFAFGDETNSTHLPHFHVPNSVVYTGTHDNDTVLGWWQMAGTGTKHHLTEYVGAASPDAMSELNWVLIRMAMASVASLAILPLQDILGLGHEARMNDPSINEGNWRWRYTRSDLLTEALADRLRKLTYLYGRNPLSSP